MNFFKKAKKGFTLVELVVVIAVIAILAAVSVGAYFGVTESANNSKLEQETKQLHTAITTVALSGGDHSSLDKNGLIINNPSLFEAKLEESLGKDVFLTDVLNSKSEEVPTIYFSEAAYSEVLGGTTVYKSFEYHLPEINGKKTVADIVTGDSKIEKVETTVANPDDGRVWYLVKDVNNLSVGDKIVIVAKDYNYAMGSTEKNNNRPSVEITKTENLVNRTEDTLIATLEAGSVEGTYGLLTKDGYLKASSSSNNNLVFDKKLTNDSSWKIEINDTVASIVAQGTNTRNVMRFNLNDKLFSCYLSSNTTMKDLAIYKVGYHYDSLCKHNFGENEKTCIECGITNPDYVAPQEPTVETKTVAQLLNESISNAVAFNVTGYIIGWYNTNYNIHIDGRFYLADSLSDTKTNSLLVYGASTVESTLEYTEDGYLFNNDTVALDTNSYKIGDLVTLKGFLFEYNSVREFNGLISAPTAKNITLNVTNNGNTTTGTFNTSSTDVIVENVEAGSVITSTVNSGDEVLYTFESFTANDAGKYKLSYDLLNKTITGECIEKNGELASILTFDDASKRESFSTTEQIWKESGITFTNSKGKCTTPFVDNVYPVRLYAASDICIEIEDKNIVSLEFTTSGDYDGSLTTVIKPTSAVTQDGNKIVIELLKPCKEFKVTLGSQLRLMSVKVNYNEEAQLEPEVVALSCDKQSVTLSDYSPRTVTFSGVLSNFVTTTIDDFSLLSISYLTGNLVTLSETGIVAAENVTTGTETITISLASNREIFVTIEVSIEIDTSSEKITTPLNLEFTGRSGNSYGDWNNSDKGITFIGNSAGGNSSIQLRSSGNSGIVVTANTNEYVVSKIEVVWNTNTTSGRKLDIYGNSNAYTSTSELYSTSTQGTKLGSIVYGTSTELNITNGDYNFIGLRSSSSAMYITSITITWVAKK